MNQNGTGFLNVTRDFRTECLQLSEGKIICVLEVYNQPNYQSCVQVRTQKVHLPCTSL